VLLAEVVVVRSRAVDVDVVVVEEEVVVFR
jgi:hypothetical protein